MINKTDDIIIDYVGFGVDTPLKPAQIVSYILESSPEIYFGKKRPAVVICPGGGYELIAKAEAEPIACKFNSAGFHAFVVNYSVTSPNALMRFPTALLELSQAVATIRGASEKYNIDTEKIIVCGFSAGAHLAGCLGLYWREPYIQRFFQFDNNENEPNGLILCYPLISTKPDITHLPSLQNLLGKYPDEEELRLISLENNVTPNTPPTFIWHTADDNVVSVQNSLLFANALSENEVPFELHIYKKGDHGISLANDVTASYPGQIVLDCQDWIEKAISFVKKL